jgi:hypothetical protein
MRVSDFTAAPKRTSEHAFEVAFSDLLTEQGIYNRHMADRVPGVPDRYVAYGRWIEFKSLYRKRGEFKFGEELSIEQWRTCEDMWKGGDWVFYSALLDGWKEGQKFVLLPFNVVLKKRGLVMDDAALPRAALRDTVHSWLRNTEESRRGNR